ncbi:FAD binding domain-containing protein [Aspergillus brunneoviolaceus CBS 621.78]|uniref:FAD binding domain-containing protein n=1 Tax=Aspergillus brunneoviolaceus CBS 621.78 TaxID=1450534 RepID=A0ACD1G0P5_9EURO|nr:FAD binding domain-containing protein [Aspergillus brunneoviolaceus CBS 621.78]RAH42804.1 FAD binding domain-containing protein [Aspergillus brunneoviolaceus CBS 621.78]
MSKSPEPCTWKNGFRQPSAGEPWRYPKPDAEILPNPQSHHVTPPSVDIVTSSVHNSLGESRLRSWHTIFNGTNSPAGPLGWWEPSSEVDVLILGAGPTGLEIALSLVRQGVKIRILDKTERPLPTGRADAVLPRYLELLHVSEEGPLIERTAIWRDGKGQLERIFVRDLLRHQVLVERCTTLQEYRVSESPGDPERPVRAVIRDNRTGETETVRAKFLVGSDGAASMIRKKLNIPFHGVSTDMCWGIMDGIFESDYPHAWIFGGYLSTEHGRDIRLYTQLNLPLIERIAKERQERDPSFKEAGGKVDTNSITPDEVLEQANRIFTPYTVQVASPLTWFAIWKVSERVAEAFSSDDLRVHLAGDAAHVHSVFGAFGFNASILNASNLAWKLGYCARNLSPISALLPTYESERRLHAANVVEISGKYLRYCCNSDAPVLYTHSLGKDLGAEAIQHAVRGEPYSLFPPGTSLPEHLYLADFYTKYGAFMLGLDVAYGKSALCRRHPSASDLETSPVVAVDSGVRAPNPRVSLNRKSTGYLYDVMRGAGFFHLVLFVSSWEGAVATYVRRFAQALANPNGFYVRFGGRRVFNVVVVTKCLPFEIEERLADPALQALKAIATVVSDDRAPDEDGHTVWGVDHGTGAVVVVRPDLWVGCSVRPDRVKDLDEYFAGFLIPQLDGRELGKGQVVEWGKLGGL